MDKHIVDEKTGIPYTLVGDYYLPWGDLPDDEPEQLHIGIWGQRHLRYIKKYRRVLYTELLTSGKLNDYLANLNEEAEEMFARLVKQMSENEGITERLKESNQMEWVRRMNNIRNRVEEIVYTEIIYN
ncbi:MAG: TnpV protein [Eubacteriales bacterium]|nr:TnpV protein [Eubacteriales bacterium]